MKIKVKKEEIDELSNDINETFDALDKELTKGEVTNISFNTPGMIEINKTVLDIKVAAMFEALRKIKSLKEFNPKRPHSI